jgi:regulator of protease activity HflC (stomatin/prohibitin superfamily)
MFREDLRDFTQIAILIITALFTLWIVIEGVARLNIRYTKYTVWEQSKVGEAALRKADWDRQIAVREAKAKMESATLLAQAEVERAKGVAEANKIIGDSLKGNEDYLRYLWIDHLQNEKNQVIYVPTEANLPILEANRLKR